MAIIDELNTLKLTIENRKTVLANNLISKGVNILDTDSLKKLVNAVADIPQTSDGSTSDNYISFLSTQGDTLTIYVNSVEYQVSPESDMYKDGGYLYKFNLSDYGITELNDCNNMFSGCHYLYNVIHLPPFTNVNSFDGMFYDRNELMYVDMSLDDNDTVDGVSLNQMFRGCTQLGIVDLSNWDSNFVIDYNFMFEMCGKLKYVICNGCDTSFIEHIKEEIKKSSSTNVTIITKNGTETIN